MTSPQEDLAEEFRLVWAAGFLAGMGTFIVTQDRVQLVLASRIRTEAIQKMADIMGANVTVGATDSTSRVTMSGEPLHRFMTKIWLHLPKERKMDYAKARKKAAGNVA